MVGFLKRMCVLLGFVPAIYAEIIVWIATGNRRHYADRLLRWGAP